MATLGESKVQEKQPLFKIGNIVRLKSGGPIMTIKSEFKGEHNVLPFHGIYNCIWHIQGEARPQTMPIEQEALESVSENEVLVFKNNAYWKLHS